MIKQKEKYTNHLGTVMQTTNNGDLQQILTPIELAVIKKNHLGQKLNEYEKRVLKKAALKSAFYITNKSK